MCVPVCLRHAKADDEHLEGEKEALKISRGNEVEPHGKVKECALAFGGPEAEGLVRERS